MGLGFNHGPGDDPSSSCCPHWSYGGFNYFRKLLATAEGFDLEAMDGYHGERNWDEITSDLKPLLNHSDCDGHLTPEECAQVFPRLREVCDGLEDAYDRRAGLALAECMLTCAAEGTQLEFC